MRKPTDVECWEKGRPDSIDRAMAAERMERAAPDLLEALRRTTEMCEAYADWIKRNVMSADIEQHPYLPELEGVAEDARAAIAKATGNA